MTSEQAFDNLITDDKKSKSRPFFLSILGTAYLVYSGLVSLLFIVAIIKNAWFTSVLADFFSNMVISSTAVLLFSIVALIVHLASFAGTILMLQLRRIGFYIYLISNLLMITIPHILNYGSWYASGIFIFFILLFSAFFRKMP